MLMLAVPRNDAGKWAVDKICCLFDNIGSRNFSHIENFKLKENFYLLNCVIVFEPAQKIPIKTKFLLLRFFF
ncbi:unnamed protein product [Thelazia callipaeda]|uniref:Uncharacterized protein n=1 Tax=Thelazia callipaeda TaxID=103827 RepID=A0A0N5CQ52_THECL|nr:unnamed protein product [Thelazia callipaeda]